MLNGKPLSIPKRIREETPDGGRGYEPPEFALRVAKLSDAAYKAAKQKKRVRVR